MAMSNNMMQQLLSMTTMIMAIMMMAVSFNNYCIVSADTNTFTFTTATTTAIATKFTSTSMTTIAKPAVFVSTPPTSPFFTKTRTTSTASSISKLKRSITPKLTIAFRANIGNKSIGTTTNASLLFGNNNNNDDHDNDNNEPLSLFKNNFQKVKKKQRKQQRIVETTLFSKLSFGEDEINTACLDGDDATATASCGANFATTIVKSIEKDVILDNGKSTEKATITTATITNAKSNNTSNNNNNQLPPEFIPILALCWCVTLLSALDRVAMSIAILPLSTEFHYTETIKGSISSAVSYGYAAAILPIGLAVSVVSSRVLMMVGVLLWSVATIGTPLMAEWSHGVAVADSSISSSTTSTTMFILPLILIRAVMGAAEAVVLPTMQRILASWVPPEKKATVLAIVLSGFQMGTVGAYLVSPYVMDAMTGLDGGGGVNGWRGMFYVYGVAGLIWLVPWWFVAKDSPSAATANGVIVGSLEDCEEILVNTMLDDDASLVLRECPVPNDDETGALETRSQTKIEEFRSLLQSAPWSDFFQSRGVWGMTLAHAAKNWGLYNLLAWTPTFYSEQYGLNVKESALYSILPSVCGMIGGLTAGNLADFILVKAVGDNDSKVGLDSQEKELYAIEKRTQVRKLFQGIALLGPAACLTLLSNIPEDVTTAQILLGGAVGLQAFDAAGFGAATQEKAGERWAGLLYSLTSLPGVMVGSLSVSATGQILDIMSDNAAGWTTVFQLNAAICVAGALSFLLLYDSKKEFE